MTIDHVQYGVGDGPCLEAARTQTMIRADMDAAAEQWPVFADRAREFGILSYLSAPILLDDEYLSALNLYSREAHGFGDTDQGVLMAARNVSADQAFELLVAESMRRNIKLRVVAEEMLAELRTR
ncbi:ANTAR domain-containing protein [Rhodococcus opacus]|uniref:ANTAR domain-containing protein n=1 Tax=Rhodococcus opacus TaxID=37919 RepID=UPI0013006124|nr:GAF and ANTAR domain-containing protein [Rhodococcus opacus]